MIFLRFQGWDTSKAIAADGQTAASFSLEGEGTADVFQAKGMSHIALAH
jgi:hypothetical protein